MVEITKEEEQAERDTPISSVTQMIGLALPVGYNVGKGFTPFLRHLSPSIRQRFCRSADACSRMTGHCTGISRSSPLFGMYLLIDGEGVARRKGVKPFPTFLISAVLRLMPIGQAQGTVLTELYVRFALVRGHGFC